MHDFYDLVILVCSGVTSRVGWGRQFVVVDGCSGGDCCVMMGIWLICILLCLGVVILAKVVAVLTMLGTLGL